MAFCVSTARVGYRRWPLFGCILGSLLFGSVQETVQAQSSAAEKRIRDEKIAAERAFKARRKEAIDLLRSSNLGTAEQEKVRAYFIGDLVQSLAAPATDPQQFPSARSDINKMLGLLGSSEYARKHDFLRDEVFKAARTIADDASKSLTSRYNALLLMADLNETEPQRAGREIRPAVPYEPARAELYKAVAADQPQAIQLAGLIGLERHTRLQIAAGKTDDKAINVAKQVLATTEPPAGGTLDGLHWMQRIAIEMISYTGKGDQIALLEPIVADETRPLLIRCTAAGAIGRLDLTGVNNVNGASLVKGLGKTALTALQNELKTLQVLVEQNPAGADFNRAPRNEEGEEEESSRRAAPEHPDVKIARRTLLFHLQCVEQGLNGLSKATLDENSKAAVAALKADVERLLKSLEQKPDQVPATFMDALSRPALQLETTVNSLG